MTDSVDRSTIHQTMEPVVTPKIATASLLDPPYINTPSSIYHGSPPQPLPGSQTTTDGLSNEDFFHSMRSLTNQTVALSSQSPSWMNQRTLSSDLGTYSLATTTTSNPALATSIGSNQFTASRLASYKEPEWVTDPSNSAMPFNMSLSVPNIVTSVPVSGMSHPSSTPSQWASSRSMSANYLAPPLSAHSENLMQSSAPLMGWPSPTPWMDTSAGHSQPRLAIATGHLNDTMSSFYQNANPSPFPMSAGSTSFSRSPYLPPRPPQQQHYQQSPARPNPDQINITSAFWSEKKTVVYQLEFDNVVVARRADNNFINGTKLLNMTVRRFLLFVRC
jgi:protein SOK2